MCADYGVNNKRGKQTLTSATSFLDYAISAGTRILDTASSYDGAYRVIENSKKIIPKKFFIIDKVSSQEVENYVKFKSSTHWPWLDKFSYKGGQVCLMLHNGKDYLDKNTRKYLQKCRDGGLVSNIGISVYETTCLEKCLSLGGLDVIQIPLSLADRRFAANKIKKKLKVNKIRVHVRSVFLQGLLLSSPVNLSENFDKYKIKFNDYLKLVPRINERLLICMASAIKDIDCSLVLGIEDKSQLDLIAKTYDSIDDVSFFTINKARTIWQNLERNITDPRCWKDLN